MLIGHWNWTWTCPLNTYLLLWTMVWRVLKESLILSRGRRTRIEFRAKSLSQLGPEILPTQQTLYWKLNDALFLPIFLSSLGLFGWRSWDATFWCPWVATHPILQPGTLDFVALQLCGLCRHKFAFGILFLAFAILITVHLSVCNSELLLSKYMTQSSVLQNSSCDFFDQ